MENRNELIKKTVYFATDNKGYSLSINFISGFWEVRCMDIEQTLKINAPMFESVSDHVSVWGRIDNIFDTTSLETLSKNIVDYVKGFLCFKENCYHLNVFKSFSDFIEFIKTNKSVEKECSLDDVILEDEVKKSILQCINFVKKASRYEKMGVTIPRGILMYGAPGCVDKDTEFFNGEKWVKMSDYKEGDKVLIYNKDGKATLEYPQRYIKEPCDNLTLITSSSGKINQCLSDEHRVIYFTRKSNEPHEILFGDFRKNPKKDEVKKYIKTSFDFEGKGVDLNDDELRVMVMTIADGYFTPNNTNYVTLRLKKERKYIRAKELLTKANIEFNEHFEEKNKYYVIHYYAPRKEKVFTNYYYNCNKRQMKVILDEVMHWDGHIDGSRKTFNTCEKESADFIQFIACSLGKYSCIHTTDRRGEFKSTNGKLYERKSIEYRVVVSDVCTKIELPFRDDRPKLKFNNYKTLDGFKYCFTVSTGMLVLRREGRIFITGNCGKTLIGKTIASQTGKKFIYKSGSEFMEKYVGVGASRIRELFQEARKEGAIIFIDEIDSIGGVRESENSKEANATLNQLLTEMDGFDDNKGIFVFGATNRLDILDPALTRPGRFTRKLEIKAPDELRRKMIFDLYINKMINDGNIDTDKLAKMTNGLSGAEIQNIVNEAAMYAVDLDRDEDILTEDDILYVMERDGLVGKESNKEKLMGFIATR